MSSLQIDPVPRLIFRIALGCLFACAAAHKLRDRSAFAAAMRAYDLAPAGWIVPLAGVLTIVEAGIGLSLWFGSSRFPAYAAVLLLSFYAAAIALNLIRGHRDIDCGCAVGLRRQSLSYGLVIRNAVLMLVGVVSGLPVAPRPLHLVDALTVTAGVITSIFLYAAVDGLLAQWSPAVRSAAAIGWNGLERGKGHA